MNKDKYVYAKIIEFSSQRIFDNIFEKYHDNKYVKDFLVVLPYFTP